MRVEYSKAFIKVVGKLSGKVLNSVKAVILEVKEAGNVDQISNCEKLKTYDNVYRIRIGSLRAFFVLHIHVEADMVIFEYLVPRGQAYTKKILDNLRGKDN
jgi:mRNA-degrading endonuclease RelE of RelBE toxin-antitoxin system